MRYVLFKTPRYAAFFCTALLVACKSNQPFEEPTLTQCSSPTTPISSVQGDSAVSPMLEREVTVRGIVTLVRGNHGLYIEDPGSDADKQTSNAIFIQTNEIPNGIEPGSLITARGKVSETGQVRQSLTTLTDVNQLILCQSNQSLPITDIQLPLSGPEREALEGMRIQLDGPLVVTDVYRFGRRNFTLSGNGLQYVPTEVMEPGPDTVELLALNKAFSLPVMMPEGMGYPKLLVSGTSVDQITGVLAHDDRGMRFALLSISTFSSTGFPPPRAVGSDALRIVGMNLHNYFNGDGRGFGFPTPRGAETAEDFYLQRQRIGAAIRVLDPHVLAVMELENDGFGVDSAAQDFIQLANKSTLVNWAVTRPDGDNTGTDQITVGLFYRRDKLEAIGPAQTLTGPDFELSRQPQAQLFRQIPDGGKILIVINHFKSKGSCPKSGGNANQKDGQGCWNPVRRSSAAKMSAWAKQVAASTGTKNILILGDMNAYRKEDPIETIRQAGFTELMDNKPDSQERGHHYSFVYYGQHGTLDFAFSSDALLEKVQQAFIWNVNAALPANMELPQPWLRFSDHDPVVVDIRLRQSITSD